MATSGTYTKTYTADYLIRRAASLVGGQPMSATDAEDSLDMLNELLIALSNDYHPLSRVKTKTVQCSASIATYDCGSSVAAVLDAVVVRSSIDYAMGRIGRADWLNFPRKDTEGKPSQFVVDQTRASVNITLWPVPDQNDSLKLRAAIRPQLFTNMHQQIDLHDRYVPAIIFGLAYKMSFERRGIEADYRLQLKAEFDNLLMEAQEEDRERTDWIITLG